MKKIIALIALALLTLGAHAQCLERTGQNATLIVNFSPAQFGTINVLLPNDADNYHDYQSEGPGFYPITIRVTTPFMNTGYMNLGSFEAGETDPVITNLTAYTMGAIEPLGAIVEFDYEDPDGIVTDIYINMGEAQGVDHHLTPNDQSGHISKGDYIYSSAGTYRITVSCRDNDGLDSDVKGFWLDVP